MQKPEQHAKPCTRLKKRLRSLEEGMPNARRKTEDAGKAIRQCGIIRNTRTGHADEVGGNTERHRAHE